jgi:predicted ATPase/class 3 adenylate cyclase
VTWAELEAEGAALRATSSTARPTGNVTFLFTDIEGSTRLWERDAAVMSRALARHNAILAEAIRAHGGHHFKTIGDAFQAAFADPAAAVAAAVEAQYALAAEPWPETGPLRVRTALHCGVAEPTPAGDFLAPSLHRLSQLLSTGFGGQVLLSNAVREAVGARLPDGVSVISLGRHRLPDLLEAEEIWQLVALGLPATFPPLKSLERFATNLPRQPTALIGREDDVAALRDLLAAEGTRLITLLGPGGVGKTRLALATAADALEQFPDGVFLVALAGTEDAALLLPEIAGTLGIREGGGRSVEENVLAYLAGKRLLLVLDNLEQLRPFAEAAAAVTRLLEAAPAVRVLATSRAPLRVRAEQEWPVAPLPTPEPGAEMGDQAALAANPAVALFVDRAQVAQPGWRLNGETAADVAEIARRLEGLPLALELAAAWVRTLPAAEILARLGGALDLLEERRGERPDRQQTLRAAIGWSHDLLAAEDRAAFRRLGPFSGGFTLDAAEAVLTAAPEPWVDALNAVAVLVEQSLLRVEEDASGDARYQMLETVRAYALEMLAAAGEADAVREAHARWVELFARDADQRLLGPEGGAWLGRLEREHDNLRAAIGWAIAQDPGGLGLRIPEATWRFWDIRGHYAEGRGWLERALAAGEEAPPELRALALEGLGNIAKGQGDTAAAAMALEASVAVWRVRDDRTRLAATLSNLGSVAELQGDLVRAQGLQEESLGLARAIGDPWRIATALNNLALVIWNQGDLARATDLLEESAALKRQVGNRVGLASTLNNLGIFALDAGDAARATAYFEETLAIDRELGNPAGIADSLGNLASIVSADDVPRSAALDIEALEIRRDLGDRLSVAYSLESIAATVTRAGLAEAGARLFGAAEQLREELSAPLPPSERERYESGVAVARDALSASRFAETWAAGRVLPQDDAVAEALAAARRLTNELNSTV